MDEENFIEVTIKKSSSSGKVGYDVKCRCSEPNEALMTERANLAIQTALKSAQAVEDKLN